MGKKKKLLPKKTAAEIAQLKVFGEAVAKGWRNPANEGVFNDVNPLQNVLMKADDKGVRFRLNFRRDTLTLEKKRHLTTEEKSVADEDLTQPTSASKWEVLKETPYDKATIGDGTVAVLGVVGKESD